MTNVSLNFLVHNVLKDRGFLFCDNVKFLFMKFFIYPTECTARLF